MEHRERPYSQFNFVVEFGGTQAGFQEVSGLGVEATVAEYRNGDEARNVARKINTTHKISDVTLKRGVIGAPELNEWLTLVRNGKQEESLKKVKIELMSEDRATVAVTWELLNARPLKYTGPSLNGKGTEVAIEELVLACEDMEIT